MDLFDRLIGTIDGLPGVRKTRPSTVLNVTPMLGQAQTYVVQTYATEEGNYGFIQMVDAEGRARIVLPPKVMQAIYRQRESLIARARREVGKARWDRMSETERESAIVRMRAGASG